MLGVQCFFRVTQLLTTVPQCHFSTKSISLIINHQQYYLSVSNFITMAPKKNEDKSNKRKSDVTENGDNKKAKVVEEQNAKVPLDKIDYSCDKKNKLGQTYNLKIASWNVAGLRACIKKGGLDYIKKEDADIFCLQEVKCDDVKLPPEVKLKFPEYKSYWCAGSKPGYAGVGLYTKVKPLKVDYGIGDPEYDSEGRLITAEYEKFYLISVYVPNAGQGLKNLDKRLKWDKLFHDYLKKLDEKKPVILTGDLNVAHNPIDLANPATNTKSAGFTIEERNSFSSFLERGFTDSYRNMYPEKTGAYTYWTYLSNARSRNTGWRLDYYVVSNRVMDNICDNVIRNQVHGSDHCPVILYINI